METRRYYFDYENGTFDYLSTPLSKFKTYLNRDMRKVLFSEKYVGNWDLLAYEVYGEEKLWWVILLANEIVDPFENSKVGEYLDIPDKKDVYDFYRENFKSEVLVSATTS